MQPEFVSEPAALRGTVRWLSGSVSGLVAGHGESPTRVIWAVVAVVAAFAGAFAAADVSNALLFSCQAMVASADTSDVATWVQWAVAARSGTASSQGVHRVL